MEIRQDIQTTLTFSFGTSKTGKTIVVTVLDTAGSNVGSGFTAGSVVELGDGTYAVDISFTAEFVGYVKFNNTTDSVAGFVPIVVKDDLTKIRKIMTNRWKITSNQLIEYDDDGTTILNTYNLLKATVANGTEPDERVPV